MTFREDETDQFPFNNTDRGVWYAIITHDILFPRLAFTSSISGKQDFVDTIKKIRREGKFYLLLGIWAEKWRTDIFILNEDIVLKRLK